MGSCGRSRCVVNRIAVTSVPWFLAVLVCLLRWIYAPHQLRYAYWAAFLFGVCITLHQSLLVAALGIEVRAGGRQSEAGPRRIPGKLRPLSAGLPDRWPSLGDHMFHNLGPSLGCC